MEDLFGTMVMVDPNLTHDPLNMQGGMGVITQAFYEDCAAYVNFGYERIGVYNNDALFMLMPADVALEKLPSAIQEMHMHPLEVVDIFNIYMLHETGKSEQQEKAFDWALGNSRISKAVVFSVQDWIDFQIERLDKQQNPGRGR